MMTATTRTHRTGYVYGDVTCLNCGRTLAAAVQRLRDGATAIRPLRAGAEVNVEVVNGVRLRCRCCGGRAFIEFDETARRRPAASEEARSEAA